MLIVGTFADRPQMFLQNIRSSIAWMDCGSGQIVHGRRLILACSVHKGSKDRFFSYSIFVGCAPNTSMEIIKQRYLTDNFHILA